MNYRLLFGVLLIILTFLCVLLYFGSISKDAEIQKATDMSASLRTYLRAIDYRCSARAGDFEKFENCLIGLIDEHQVAVDLEEDEWKRPSLRANQTGFIVMKNVGRNSMDSSKFTLSHNKVVVDEGCVIPGSIDPDYTCRLDFGLVCDDGDVLEVAYDGKPVHIRNC